MISMPSLFTSYALWHGIPFVHLPNLCSGLWPILGYFWPKTCYYHPLFLVILWSFFSVDVTPQGHNFYTIHVDYLCTLVRNTIRALNRTMFGPVAHFRLTKKSHKISFTWQESCRHTNVSCLPGHAWVANDPVCSSVCIQVLLPEFSTELCKTFWVHRQVQP